jgi:protoporphyrinogen oxidase
MIGKKEFVKCIKKYKEQENNLDKLVNCGFDISDSEVIDFGFVMFDMLINTHFTEEGCDLIYNYLFEDCKKDFHPIEPDELYESVKQFAE